MTQVEIFQVLFYATGAFASVTKIALNLKLIYRNKLEYSVLFNNFLGYKRFVAFFCFFIT